MVPVSKGRTTLAKPNYQYEKRQRELAKKAKKAEKAARKAAGKPDDGDPGAPDDGLPPAEGEATVPGAPAPADGQG
ncbi:MAG: hypothetical protein RJA99_1485 [Pseudomonadota bacterium]|jgi:hypothetical protein